jgi:hypothetical protein
MARKREIHMSRTEMHNGISSARNTPKWRDVLNIVFKNNSSQVAPRKRVYINANG